jgi:hypothetical protein
MVLIEVIYMTKFETKENELYIAGNKVLRAWESWSGWYWFATEKVGEQLSLFGDGKEVPATIWYGYVEAMDDRWDFCS